MNSLVALLVTYRNTNFMDPLYKSTLLMSGHFLMLQLVFWSLARITSYTLDLQHKGQIYQISAQWPGIRQYVDLVSGLTLDLDPMGHINQLSGH